LCLYEAKTNAADPSSLIAYNRSYIYH